MYAKPRLAHKGMEFNTVHWYGCFVDKILNREQAKAFYDRFGKKQDAQSFYEDAALDLLMEHADLHHATNVLEFGCGTGRFAARMLSDYLPASATYVGTDISDTMIALASRRISAFTERARVTQTDGVIHFPVPDNSVDRVVATYVLDLLSETDIRLAVAEARRVLCPGGKLCLVSLTYGKTAVSRVISSAWTSISRISARLVGGCRPIQLQVFFDAANWLVDYHSVISRYGIPSEVLVLTSKSV